jgi:hypothetical protein
VPKVQVIYSARRRGRARIRSFTVAVTALLLLVVGTIPAHAAVIPRISGTHQVKATVLVHQNNPSDVGTTVTRTWKFKPKCTGTKGCETTFTRQRGTPPLHPVYSLKPVLVAGVWHYRGSTTYREACIRFSDGAVLDPRGYRTHETMDITVLARNAHNAVTRFKAHYVLNLARTASAPKVCVRDHNVYKAVSTS